MKRYTVLVALAVNHNDSEIASCLEMGNYTGGMINVFLWHHRGVHDDAEQVHNICNGLVDCKKIGCPSVLRTHWRPSS